MEGWSGDMLALRSERKRTRPPCLRRRVAPGGSRTGRPANGRDLKHTGLLLCAEGRGKGWHPSGSLLRFGPHIWNCGSHPAPLRSTVCAIVGQWRCADATFVGPLRQVRTFGVRVRSGSKHLIPLLHNELQDCGHFWHGQAWRLHLYRGRSHRTPERRLNDL
jgi:hypothetical protein